MKINFSAAPSAPLTSDQLVPDLSIELIYTAAAEQEDGTMENIQRTVRFALDATMKGGVSVDDASAADLRADVLTSDGTRALSITVTANNAGNATLTFSAADLDMINAVRPKTPDDPVQKTTKRTLRLVPVTDTVINYGAHTAFTSAVPNAEALAAIQVAGLQNNGGARIASMELLQGELANLTGVQWTSAHLAVDGTLTATFDRQKGLGWLWWLNGERQLLGFVPDDLSTDQKDMAVALPALSKRADNRTTAATATDCECGKAVSANVTEAELANNPGVYSEDPGSFCEPFSNPERVLSEKSFKLIARITQPEIGAVSSKNVRSVKLLELEGEGRSAGNASDTSAPGFFARVFGSASPAKPSVSDKLPLRHILPAAYKAFVAALPSGRTDMNQQRPLQWEDDMAQYQATTVALGHILDFRMRWRSNGYSLGTVAKTLTLAPRQAKRIQKVEWERSERAQRRERTQLSDQENDSTFRERDYQDQVSANLSEWASGSSHSDVEGFAAGIGFFVEGVLGGIGGGAGSSNSASSQEGGRHTSASEHQRLRDGIRRHGDALRKFESTVVNEVSQEENVTGTTEVVRNLNYAHSLTVIYYQILRHLRVDTEFAGARQCLFVPFALRPFDLQRAYRWREAIQASIRSTRFLRALRYLKDVLNNFATSDIPVGTRAQQPLTYLRGSMFIDLAIARPRENNDGTVDPGPWSLLQHLLSDPLGTITSNLQGMASSERDRAFQSRFAPGIAAKWCNRITLKIGSVPLVVDCTLATRYQFNRSVRVDFVVDPTSLAGFTRAQLESVTVAPLDPLAPGSVANLRSIRFTYSTARFERSVAGRTGVNDLILQDTGATDSANVQVPLDSWERVDERLEIRRSVNDLVEHLNEHVEYYHKAIWWRMDRDRLLMMLDGFYVPNTDHVSIASVVDREPLGIIGNCLVYRVGAAYFIPNGPITDQEKLYGLYAQKEPVSDPLYISLPTDGLYAQTIMDKCLALEEHFGNLDWALNDKDPELGSIDPSLLMTRRADTTTATTPTAFPATIINLQNAPDAPAPSGLQGVLNAVTNPNAFRDMAGLAATQANALAGFQAAASLATNFGNQAAGLELAKMAKAQEATRTADQKLASIKRAEEKRLTTPEEAQRQAKEVLTAMNPDTPKAAAPHEDPAINAAIDAARSVPGSTVEASTGEGGVKVTMGGNGTMLASLNQPIQQVCGFFGQNNVTTETDLRTQIAQAATDERLKWFNAAQDAAHSEDEDAQFGLLVKYWLASNPNIQPTTLTALQNQAALAGFDYSELLADNDPNADIRAALTTVRTRLITAAAVTTSPSLNDAVEAALTSARLSRIDADSSPWSAVFVVSLVRGVGITDTIEAMNAGRHVGKDALLKATSAHRIYAAAAFNNRQAGKGGTYHSFDPSTRAVQVGDIIVQDRRTHRKAANVVKFSDVATLTSGVATHGDIVVQVDQANSHVTTIGGNLGDGGRRRRYPIDANGQLIVAADRDYTQEAADGTLADPPAAINPAPAEFNDLGTGRIFALLSPVPECIVVPGTSTSTGTLV